MGERSTTIRVNVELHPGVGALGDEATFYIAAKDIPEGIAKLQHLIKCNYTLKSVIIW